MVWLLSRTTLSAAGLPLPIRDLTGLTGEEMLGGVSPGEPARCPGPLLPTPGPPPRSPAPQFLRSTASFRPHGAALTDLFRCVSACCCCCCCDLFPTAGRSVDRLPRVDPPGRGGGHGPGGHHRLGPPPNPRSIRGQRCAAGSGHSPQNSPDAPPTPVSHTVGVHLCFPQLIFIMNHRFPSLPHLGFHPNYQIKCFTPIFLHWCHFPSSPSTHRLLSPRDDPGPSPSGRADRAAGAPFPPPPPFLN